MLALRGWMSRVFPALLEVSQTCCNGSKIVNEGLEHSNCNRYSWQGLYILT